MEELNQLFSVSFIMLSLGTSAIVYALDLIVKYVFGWFGKVVGENKCWKELVLPLAPLAVGGGLGYLGDGWLVGVVAGMLSGLIWRVVKSMLKSRMKTDS